MEMKEIEEKIKWLERRTEILRDVQKAFIEGVYKGAENGYEIIHNELNKVIGEFKK